MRLSKYKKIIAALLCGVLTVSLLTPGTAYGMPVVGPTIGSVAETAESPTEPETEPVTGPAQESTAPEEGSSAEPTESAAETEPAVEPPTEPGEENARTLSVDQLVNLKHHSDSESTALEVITENGSSAGVGNVYSGVLLAKRLKKLAEFSEFNAIIFRGSSYVRVRAAADTVSDIKGKMYYNAVASVTETIYTENGVWYHIASGDVDGYVKSEFFVSGSEAMDLIGEVMVTWATPINDSQRMYKSANTSSDTLASLSSDMKYKVLSIGESYTKLFYGTTTQGVTVSGYVPNSSIRLTQETITAVSIEAEERAIVLANQALAADESREASRAESRYRASVAPAEAASRAQASREQASRMQAALDAAKAGNVSKYSQYIPAGTSALRKAIVLDAIQYVGVLEYKWGWASLTEGADCSGFLKAIFGNHGIYLEHYSKTQARTGTKVLGLGNARPGDIVCYHCGPNDSQGHVALYIGNGYVVHAPTTGQKVKVSPADMMEIYTIQNVIGD